MGNEGTVTASGSRTGSHEFNVYPWGTSFKALGGVYLVLKSTGAKYNVLYVGQTGDLSERFDNHHKLQSFNRHGKTHIAVMVEGNERNRLNIESDLIDQYNPPCNG